MSKSGLKGKFAKHTHFYSLVNTNSINCTCRILLSNKADVNVIDKKNRTVINYLTKAYVEDGETCTNDFLMLEIVELLFAAGYEVGVKDYWEVSRHVDDPPSLHGLLRFSSHNVIVAFLRLLEGEAGAKQKVSALSIEQIRDLLKVPTLKSFCRDSIRQYLLTQHMHTNLFCVVPLIPLTKAMKRYLMYGVTL